MNLVLGIGYTLAINIPVNLVLGIHNCYQYIGESGFRYTQLLSIYWGIWFYVYTIAINIPVNLVLGIHNCYQYIGESGFMYTQLISIYR